VEAVATAFIESTGAASGDVTTIGEAPDELVGLSAEERSAASLEHFAKGCSIPGESNDAPLFMARSGRIVGQAAIVALR